ncbi:hypothetical protein LZZ85_00015 [Terrimonas sp. NA20]|uniref:Uncharacterized protein n=1 Tax=Terrimonas ginsenosidimutans TaxID=2908004 RepID=A0ABS9KJX8_9BACT|nr:hypothetical protein [Terrimonas ginsenosidimutans]MCG2612633.1 hypothetical protein [Terrimonas ginsenosidimutans]
MIRAVENTINYFRPKQDYFWHWADNAGVIEWRINETTICFKDDLAFILRQFPEDKLPRLGSLLFVMYACNNKISSNEKFALRKMFDGETEVRVTRMNNAMIFLDLINSLPPSLRSGNKRVQLIKEIFSKEESNERESHPVSINELQSGRLDAELMIPQGYISSKDIMADFNCMVRASEKFPTLESLELFLRTGIESLPEPSDVEVPEEQYSEDLFDQLLEDTDTAGISRLARRLLSIINIPIHSRAGGEDSYGGIADITNRGNYDRLLLSELAQDDLLLTARLVNNEALYFRREEPPAEPRNRRIILIDSTIKMWGVPRVFAIASALAFTRNSKHGEQVEAYVLKESTYEKLSLNEKQGVINALSQLHPALHPGKALKSAVDELRKGEEAEFIFITEERQMKHAGFYADFFNVKEKISFNITVSRDGNIRFAEYVNGHSKLLNEATLDINEFLSTKSGKISKLSLSNQRRPSGIQSSDFKFFYPFPLPLLFLKRNISVNNRFIVKSPTGSAIVIDRSRRVLLLNSGFKGASELMKVIEPGIYSFDFSQRGVCYILVRSYDGKSILKLYTIELEECSISEKDLLPDILGTITDAGFCDDGFLYFFSDFVVYQYNFQEMLILKKIQYASLQEMNDVKQTTLKREKVDLVHMSGLMKSPNYQVIYKAESVFISYSREVVWGRFSLKLGELTGKLMFSDAPDYRRLVTATLSDETYFNGTKIKCRKAAFPDGSIALMDKRGVLHLKSADPSLPEVSVIAITSLPTAAYSSEIKFCGSRFFIDDIETPGVIPDDQFYAEYLLPFINHIIDNASSPKI